MHLRMVRACLIVTASAVIIAVLGFAQEASKTVALFNGRDFAGWTRFAQDPRANVNDMFKVNASEEAIIIEGKSMGYLITDKEYDNYELSVEWRWGAKDAAGREPGKYPGNSGILLHVNGPNKIWPRSIEAQLQSNHAGDFWLIDGHPLRVDAGRQDPRSPRHFFKMKQDAEKPIGEWNKYEITCRGGEVALKVNGVEMNQGSGAEPSRGKIAFQAEGAEIHLRKIMLKSLK